MLDVTTDIANFGELGCFDFDERRIGKFCQPPGNLGLAAPGGADHQNVFWRHLVAQVVAKALTPPTVAQGNGDRSLRVRLTDDMFVERGDNCFGGKGRAHETLSNDSIVNWSFV